MEVVGRKICVKDSVIPTSLASAINLRNRRGKKRTNRARLCKTKRPSNKSDRRAPPSTQWGSRGDFGLAERSERHEVVQTRKKGERSNSWKEIYADFYANVTPGTGSQPPATFRELNISSGLCTADSRWRYFWNSTVRLKYLTVYLPLPRFLLTRHTTDRGISFVFRQIIHEVSSIRTTSRSMYRFSVRFILPWAISKNKRAGRLRIHCVWRSKCFSINDGFPSLRCYNQVSSCGNSSFSPVKHK